MFPLPWCTLRLAPRGRKRERGKSDQLAKKLVNLWTLFLNDMRAGSEWAINELEPSKAQARVLQGLLERAYLPSLHFDDSVWRGRN